MTATEPPPVDRAISKEEESILWRSLERIPDVYREPLVLYYREHQSVKCVAEALELSEDAVRQRLSRGRKLLQEQVMAFVEGTLEHTNPGPAFTLHVMAALPLLATSTTAAAAMKGSATAKATGGLGFWAAIFGLPAIVSLGAYLGLKMSGDAVGSERRRESVAKFWRTVVLSLALFIMLPIVLPVVLGWSGVWRSDSRAQVLAGLTLWLGLLYVVVMAAVALWWWRRRAGQARGTDDDPPRGHKRKSVLKWVIIAMLGSVILLIALVLDSNWKVGRLSTAEAQRFIVEHPDARFSIMEHQDGNRFLWLELCEKEKNAKFIAPADEATRALLAKKNIACPTYVQGRDFEIFGWPGKLLPLLCIFILAAGLVILLSQLVLRRASRRENAAQSAGQRMERTVGRMLAGCAALVMIAAAVMLGGFTTWGSRTLSTTEAQRIITEQTDVRSAVFHYRDGTSELWITPRNYHNRPPKFIAPTDPATLSLLAAKGITYRTYVQGRDFGVRRPGRTSAALGILLLLAGAGFIFRRLWQQQPRSGIAG